MTDDLSEIEWPTNYEDLFAELSNSPTPGTPPEDPLNGFTVANMLSAIAELRRDAPLTYDIRVDELLDSAYLVDVRPPATGLYRLSPYFGPDYILTGSTSAIGALAAYHLAGAYHPEVP